VSQIYFVKPFPQLSDEAVIVPTVQLDLGTATAKKAVRSAGLDCFGIISHDPEKTGFTSTVNDALVMILNAQFVAIVSDDAVLPENWFARMAEILTNDPGIGIVGAGGPCRTPPQSGVKPGMPAKVLPASQLAFSCVVIRREVISAIGLLDSEFIHYGSDSDYCERVKRAGWRLAVAQDVYVEREMHQEIAEWKEHDMDLFRKKWGW
jgi:GT2 family glycosyltransferase